MGTPRPARHQRVGPQEGGYAVQRHDAMRDQLAAIACRGLPGDARVEPRTNTNNGDRLDLRWAGTDGIQEWIDTAIVNPTSARALAANAHRFCGAAARRAELGKARRYPDVPNLRPAVFEAGGRMGTQMLSILRGLCPHPATDPRRRSAWITEAQQDLSVTLQKAHARALRDAAARASAPRPIAAPAQPAGAPQQAAAVQPGAAALPVAASAIGT